MASGLWTPDTAREAAHECHLCGEKFPRGHEQSFGRHLRKCSEGRADQLMAIAEAKQADGFQTGFDKERIKFERDRGRRG